MSKYFLTFGAGSKNYIEAGERLKNQINDLNLFDKLLFYTDEYLKNDPDFWNQHSNFIQNNPRGYGYWLWKPYIVKKTIEQMNDGDILLYLDCGCEFDIKKKDKLINHFELVKKDYVIGIHTCLEKDWTKMDLILELDMLHDKYLNTPQHQAGVVLYLVCNETRNLVNKWYEVACNYHNIDDTVSINKNLDCFQEHRHDQSIFSLLTKKLNLFSSNNLHDCINVYRNISGISRINS